ncbi:MAG: iron-siderophore ABC transporter substrate-binding protein [Rivularia sp. (in: cyanobacteria)]
MMKHAMGETCIPRSPQRLVTISDFSLHHALFLGVKPIGSAFDDWRGKVPTYLTNKSKEIEQIEELGQQSQPNIEKILQLKPDLIVSWGEAQAVYPLLSQIAPTVMGTLKFSGNDGWREHFNFVAQTLGKEDAAKQAWNRYYQRIKELKIALNNQYQNKTISVLTVAHDFENHATSKNSFVGSIFNDAGLKLGKAQNVYGGAGWIQFSPEEFIDFFDGDILFVTVTGDADRKKLEELQTNPFWKKLKAVREGKVYVVDSLTWQGGNLFAANAVIDDLFKYLVNAS